MDKTLPDVPTPDEIEALLARNPAVAGACELDLLVFLYRHPRSLLTNEQLADFIGYGMKQIADARNAFIEAGLLERTQTTTHAARMYLLLLAGPQMEGLRKLLAFASTMQGRRSILKMLTPGKSGRPV